MAFNFVRASSQYFTQSVLGRSVTGPATLSVRFNASDATTNQVQLSIRNANAKFMTYLLATTRNAVASCLDYGAESSTAYTLGADGCLSGRYSINASNLVNSRVVFLNGSGKGENTAVIGAGPTAHINLNEVGIGARYTNSWGAFMNGQISEAAIWSAHLTDEEIMSLAKGFSPKRVRPQSLVFYAPLIRNTVDLKSPIALTAVNSPTVANHPRVY